MLNACDKNETKSVDNDGFFCWRFCGHNDSNHSVAHMVSKSSSPLRSDTGRDMETHVRFE